MVQKIKVLFATLVLSVTMAVPALAPVTVYAGVSLDSKGNVDVAEGLCSGAKIALGEDNCDDNGQAATSVSSIIQTVINIISIIVGVAAVIMIIVGGLRYITSSGDSSSVSSAKNTILYAIVGLVVVALAQILVRFVIDKLQDATTPVR
jgi:uncharacterized membrane protein YuzA (DUF378 family)